jgi:hypothetical protein
MKKLCKEEYLILAKQLDEDESERLLSRMTGKLPRRFQKDKLSREEALAIQLEWEDDQLQEWREVMGKIHKQDEEKEKNKNKGKNKPAEVEVEAVIAEKPQKVKKQAKVKEVKEVKESAKVEESVQADAPEVPNKPKKVKSAAKTKSNVAE